MSELSLNAGTLPAPYTCWQALYAEMFALGSANGPTITGILIQDTTPAAEDRDKGWIPTAAGVPRYPGWVFTWNPTLGHWMSRHWKGASDPRPEMYIGDIADLSTLDGGDANTLGPASGPFWEQYTAITGRVPIGVGAIPGSTPPITTALADTGGEAQHVLTAAEMEGHYHGVGTDGAVDGNDPPIMISRPWSTAPTNLTQRLQDSGGSGASWGDGGSFASGTMGTTDPLTGSTDSDAHNNLQPYLAVYWIKRTSRIWIVAA